MSHIFFRANPSCPVFSAFPVFSWLWQYSCGPSVFPDYFFFSPVLSCCWRAPVTSPFLVFSSCAFSQPFPEPTCAGQPSARLINTFRTYPHSLQPTGFRRIRKKHRRVFFIFDLVSSLAFSPRTSFEPHSVPGPGRPVFNMKFFHLTEQWVRRVKKTLSTSSDWFCLSFIKSQLWFNNQKRLSGPIGVGEATGSGWVADCFLLLSSIGAVLWFRKRGNSEVRSRLFDP